MHVLDLDPTSNTSEFVVMIEYIDRESGLPMLLTGYSAAVELRDRQGNRLLYGDNTTGHVPPLADDGMIICVFPEDEMRRLEPGSYEIAAEITTPLGVTSPLGYGVVEVRRGIGK